MRFHSLFCILLPLLLSQANCEIGQFVHLTDIHLDLNYATDLTNSTNITCWQNVTGDKGIFGSYLCDSPARLLDETLQAVSSELPNPDFIVYTGDSMAHIPEWAYNTKSLIKSFEHITSAFKKYFPNTKVYPLLGNHDYWPNNQLPAHSNELYNAVADLWKDWIGEEAAETMKKYGYYKLKLAKNHTLLALNTNFYSPLDKLDMGNDPGDQFKWINQQINTSENSEKFAIIGHVPPGVYERTSNFPWMQEKYNKVFLDIVVDKWDKIDWMLFGHSHKDSFRLVYDSEKNLKHFMLIAPAVTPWKDTYLPVGANNPAFRIIDYDKDSFDLMELRTFYMDLEKSNQVGQAQWHPEYNFTQTYVLEPPLTATKMFDTFEKICHLGFMDQYYLYNSASYGNGGIPVCVGKCKQEQLCAIEWLDLDSYRMCLAQSSTSTTTSTTPSNAINIVSHPLFSLLLISLSLAL